LKQRSISCILRSIHAQKVSIIFKSDDGTEYFYLGDLPSDGTIPACLFLAGFDQMIMRYKNRECILEEKHKRDVMIITSGIILPTIMLNGSISARWRISGAKLITVPFVKMTKETRSTVAEFGKKLLEDAAGITQVVFE